ncbi:ABC transporter permease [Pseudonocardia pini]|uniref:ABC transporter permease n=1 Tax=Pseudonocardia pini TaxID=2758030 RepID=UPI0015F0372B|nr:ABC transporter permease subunit [Pseudonocardia pini]
MTATTADRMTGRVWAGRLAVLAVGLAAWQFLPQVEWLRERATVFDPFFVSSPSRVAERLWELCVGSGPDGVSVWPVLVQTLVATFAGVIIGTVLGGLAGVVLSSSIPASRILGPFVAFFNAMPRIALVPIFVILAGPTTTATVLTAVAVIFFLVFYNAFAGGRSVPPEVVQSTRLLGASPRSVMFRVRLPYVAVWTLAALPNAISFGLVAVVTAEILTGRVGMGRLLLNSISTADATLTFAVVFLLAVVGVVLVSASDLVSRRALHWWENS